MNSENGSMEDPGFRSRLAEIIDADEPFAWAARVGIPSASFSRMWNLGVVPKAPHLKRIREATGVSLDWLLTGEGPKRPGGDVPQPANPQMQADAGPGDQPLPLVPDILEGIIEGMELALQARQITLTPQQKAQVVSTLYAISYRRYMVRAAGGTPPDVEKEFSPDAMAPDVADLIRLMKRK